MRVLLFYNREIKNSPLDAAVLRWAKKNRARVMRCLYDCKIKEKPDIVIPRQSYVNTLPFEIDPHVVVLNKHKNRVRAKDKFLLDKILKDLGIKAPYTIPYAHSPKITRNLPFPLILKPIVGAKGYGVVDIPDAYELKTGENIRRFGTEEMLQKHFLLQEKIEGDLYKVYGPCRGKWFFMNKTTGTEGFIPPAVAKNCNKILEIYDLNYMGVDFIVKGQTWYPIDVNATTGCKSLSKKNCQKLADAMLSRYASKPRTVISAGGIVIKDFDGKLKIALVYDPKKGRKNGGKGWVLPRGHVERGETLKEAALREIEEESGLKKIRLFGEVGTLKKFGRESNGERVFKVIHYFIGYAGENHATKPHPHDKHTATKWLSISEALSHCFYRQEADLLKKVMA